MLKAGAQSSYGAKSKSLPKLRKEPPLSEPQIARKLGNYSAQLSAAILKGDSQAYSTQVSNFMNLFMLGRENVAPASHLDFEDEEFEDEPMQDTIYSQNLVPDEEVAADDDSIATRESLSAPHSPFRARPTALGSGNRYRRLLLPYTQTRLPPHLSKCIASRLPPFEDSLKNFASRAASPASSPLHSFPAFAHRIGT
jgi:hypothetical protein